MLANIVEQSCVQNDNHV